jgi:hypothetical protein
MQQYMNSEDELAQQNLKESAVITPACFQQNWIVCRFRSEIWAKTLKKQTKFVADGLYAAKKYKTVSRTG